MNVSTLHFVCTSGHYTTEEGFSHRFFSDEMEKDWECCFCGSKLHWYVMDEDEEFELTRVKKKNGDLKLVDGLCVLRIPHDAIMVED